MREWNAYVGLESTVKNMMTRWTVCFDGFGDDVDDDDDDDDAAHLYSFNILFIDCVQKGILRLHLNVIIVSWLQIRRIWPK